MKNILAWLMVIVIPAVVVTVGTDPAMLSLVVIVGAMTLFIGHDINFF